MIQPLKGKIELSGTFVDSKSDGPFPPLYLKNGSVIRCPYKACASCDCCAVCGSFHGNFVGGCKEGQCPYRWWHRIRDRVRRWLIGANPMCS